MSEDTDEKLTRVGLKVTKVYVILLLGGIPVAAFYDLVDLDSVKLNELGDFLAGAFGPLALFWLVLGFLLQSKELRNSVDALNVQTDELRQTVKIQNRMAESANSDLKLQETRRAEANWLEARKAELDILNCLADVRANFEVLKRSRERVLAAKGMRNSGLRQRFEEWHVELEPRTKQIEHALNNVCPLKPIAEGGPTVTDLGLLHDLKHAAISIKSEVNQELRKDDIERESLRVSKENSRYPKI